MNMIFCYIISAAAFTAGIMFYTGKAARYIKGYTSLTEDEKKKIDIKALCKTASIVFFTATVIFGIAGYSNIFRELYLKWGMVALYIIGTADVIYISKSKRFGNKNQKN